jgi:hypothetical protein
VILWKDFVIDDEIGPYLVCCEGDAATRDIMDDVTPEYQIQETRQETRPARMVGRSSLESSARVGMEAGPGSPPLPQQGGSA